MYGVAIEIITKYFEEKFNRNNISYIQQRVNNCFDKMSTTIFPGRSI